METKRPTVTLAPTHEVDIYEEEITSLLENLVQVKGALFTDESELRDFASCGEGFRAQDAVNGDSFSLRELYDQWETWMLAELKAKYGLKLASTRIRLVDLIKLVHGRG